MKIIKPQKLGILQRTFESAGRVRVCLTGIVGAPFDDPAKLLHEVNLWKTLAAELGKDTAPDLAMPKARPEVLVIGSAHPPEGPQPSCSVRLRMGLIDKTLRVFGDRTWSADGAASEPVPFTAMPITWANAFGGSGYTSNPVGKGFAPVAGEDGEVFALPNVEDPKHLIQSRDDRPEAAGFGPSDPSAPDRIAKTGTYDDAWLAEQSPGLPHDFDFAYYNAAPLDQQLDAPFAGDEAFALENMHPSMPFLEGRLPGFIARFFVSLRGGELREVPMRIETVQLFPGARLALILFRGITIVEEDDASDVLHLIAACEKIGAPRPVAHYEAVLAERLDKKRGALASLRDSDLMPPGPAAKVYLDEVADPDLASPSADLQRRNLRDKTEREREAARARLREAGLDPDEHLPQDSPAAEPDPRGPALDEIEEIVTRANADGAKQKADADARIAEAERKARAECEAAGLDYDQKLAEQQKQQGGPPKLSASYDGMEITPEARAQLLAAEERMRDAYRRHAHLLPAAPVAEASRAAEARLELSTGVPAGTSFAGRDFTGASLAGLDLRGADLRSAFLEGASLAGANLAGADLTNAVLARADLASADLTGAKLAGCNMGKAKLTGAKIEGGVDLTRAILAGADLTGASFRGARLDRVDLGEAIFHDTDLRGVSGENVTFMNADLRGAKLAGASFPKCNFIEVDLRGVDLSGADLTAATWVHVDAAGVVLRGARLSKLRVVSESSLPGADFTDAVLDGANLRGTKLAQSLFVCASLRGADLSGGDLSGARFDRAIAPEIRLTKADLTQASFAGANLMLALLDRATARGTSFLGANLFRADLGRMIVDDATDMQDAHTKQALITAPRGSHGAS
ncbi:Pentapeptide repeat family protein [Minicystis rosea]|nr:Pentapeptide repeat family protein [Minicystis rosea]